MLRVVQPPGVVCAGGGAGRGGRVDMRDGRQARSINRLVALPGAGRQKQGRLGAQQRAGMAPDAAPARMLSTAMQPGTPQRVHLWHKLLSHTGAPPPPPFQLPTASQHSQVRVAVGVPRHLQHPQPGAAAKQLRVQHNGLADVVPPGWRRWCRASAGCAAAAAASRRRGCWPAVCQVNNHYPADLWVLQGGASHRSIGARPVEAKVRCRELQRWRCGDGAHSRRRGCSAAAGRATLHSSGESRGAGSRQMQACTAVQQHPAAKAASRLPHLRPGARQQLLSHIGDLDGAVIAHHEAARRPGIGERGSRATAERQGDGSSKLTVCRNRCMR